MTRFINPVQSAFDTNGDPVSGAKLYFYAAGTTTPKTTYSDNALTTANTNPVVADSAGRFGDIHLDTSQGMYKVVLKDAVDVTIWTRDNLQEYGVAAFFERFSGTGSKTAFTLSNDAGTDEKGLMVFVDGAILDPLADYTVNATVLTLTTAPASGTNNIAVWAVSETVYVNAAVANASASSAAASANAAATSATNAATSESNAATSETNAATSATAAATSALAAQNAVKVRHTVALSDETTPLVAAVGAVTFRSLLAFTLTEVRASLTGASSSGVVTVDINVNGATILSTKLTIDATEKTSTTAVAAAVISTSAIADDAEITMDIDTAGTGATGLKVTMIGDPA